MIYLTPADSIQAPTLALPKGGGAIHGIGRTSLGAKEGNHRSNEKSEASKHGIESYQNAGTTPAAMLLISHAGRGFGEPEGNHFFE